MAEVCRLDQSPRLVLLETDGGCVIEPLVNVRARRQYHMFCPSERAGPATVTSGSVALSAAVPDLSQRNPENKSWEHGFVTRSQDKIVECDETQF